MDIRDLGRLSDEIAAYCAGLLDTDPVDRCEQCGARLDAPGHRQPCDAQPNAVPVPRFDWWILRGNQDPLGPFPSHDMAHRISLTPRNKGRVVCAPGHTVLNPPEDDHA